MRVLVIEDNTDIATNIGDYLEDRGHVVDFAGDGVTGLHLAVVHDFDVIVLDLTLPGMDGLAAAHAIRARERDTLSARSVILAVTADAMPDTDAAARSAGIDAVVTKPMTPDSLRRALAELAQFA